jgi:hypothetical protein
MLPGEMVGVSGITAFRTKVAVTVVGTVSVIEQLARVLEHPVAFPVPLLQPIKVEPLLPTAWRTSAVPVGYWPAQPLKCTPPSVLHVIIPIPVPPVKIDRGTSKGFPGNRAVTVVSTFIVTTHGPVPEQPPPLNPINPGPVAVSVTTVFVGTTKEHVPAPALQLIPAGVDVTVPPLSITVSIFNEV